MNPALWLARTAQRMPDAPALFSGTRCVADYRTFARHAGAIAEGLAARGIKADDRVAVFATNSTDYLKALYGIWWLGAMAVPINAKLHTREALWIIENAGVSLAFTDPANMDDLSEALPCIALNSAELADLCEGTTDRQPAPRDPDDVTWLFYTSGTTGRPKGVMITAGNIASMALSYTMDVDTVSPEDAILYAAPMSHGAGIYNFMHVMRGARHVVPESAGFDAAEILDLAPKIESVSMFAAPTMVRRLVDEAKAAGETGEGLRSVIYAGGPMYEADILDAVETMGARFIQVYGQGECPMGITVLPRDDVTNRTHPRWRDRLNSVGYAQSEVEVAILDKDGTPLPHGEVGEIVVRGRTVMKGYWQNREATANTLRNGWLWTGDMGRLDGDGYLTLQDRSKDMIISGGSNIYPREVEEVLLSHKDVHEVAIVGQKNDEWGEIVVAFVVTHTGVPLDEAGLDTLCLDTIARFKRPKHYIQIDALPKNNYGKVLKTELRKALLAGG